MTLWKVEWLRLWRTRRWIALAGVYVGFGLIGPVLARYGPQLAAHAAGNIKITLPPPTPIDGPTQYVRNSIQVALVVALVVAANTLAFDNRPAYSAFYRTRVRKVVTLIAPRYCVAAASTIAAFVLGSSAAWYETTVLLGHLDAGRFILSVGLEAVYLALATAVVACAASLVRTTLATAGISIAVLAALPLLAVIDPLGHWTPSALVGSIDAILRGRPAHEFLRALATAVIATGGLLAVGAYRLQRREV